MAQNVKKVASKNLKKPKVAENSKSCQNSKKLPKISKVAEKLPSNLWLSLTSKEAIVSALKMNDVLSHPLGGPRPWALDSANAGLQRRTKKSSLAKEPVRRRQQTSFVCHAGELLTE